MIAVLRVRFTTNTDALSVWPDNIFQNWLDPTIPYSLANYWWEASWGMFDFRYNLFPPFVMIDPRPAVVLAPGENSNAKYRAALVNGAVQQATALFQPNWDSFSHVLIWYAQPTDMFGGGSVVVPLKDGGSKVIPDALVDIASPFDGVCQETGHGFGLGHELDAAGGEYQSPYSIMSGLSYIQLPSFVRPADPRLPDGVRAPNVPGSPSLPYPNDPPQRVIGPLLCAAQLYNFPWFQNPPQVVQVPGTFRNYPASIKLYALDHARSVSQNASVPALAIIPPTNATSRTFAVELRRGGHGLYDQHLGATGAPPAALVIHSFNPDGRVRYEGALPLHSGLGNLEWSSVAHLVTIRLEEVEDGDLSVRFLVGGGTFWQQRNASLDEGSELVAETVSDFKTVVFDEACLQGPYRYQEKKRRYDEILIATSYGFDNPEYRWYINGTRISPTNSFTALTLNNVEVTNPIPSTQPNANGAETKTMPVVVYYEMQGNKLTLRAGSDPGNFGCNVRVEVSDPVPADVFTVNAEKHFYFQCHRFEWEKAYYDKLDECYEWANKMWRTRSWRIHIDPGYEPPYVVRPGELEQILKYERVLHTLQRSHPEQAHQLMTYMVQRFNVPRQVILKRMD